MPSTKRWWLPRGAGLELPACFLFGDRLVTKRDSLGRTDTCLYTFSSYPT